MSSPTEERTLTFMDKINIVQYLLSNVNAEEIAERFGTTLAKVFAISQNHQTIMEVYKYYLRSQEFQLKTGHYPRMENILYAWFSDQTYNVTNKELGARARVIVDVINEQASVKNAFPFTGTNNWVNAFKTRYDINKKPSPTTMNWELGSSSGVLNVSSGVVDGSVYSDCGSLGNSSSNDTDNKVERKYDPSMADNATEPKTVAEEFQCSDTDDSVAEKPNILGSTLEGEFEAEAYQLQDIPTAVNIITFGNRKTVQIGDDMSAHTNQEDDDVRECNESREDLISKKRKRSSFNTDDSSSDELSDCGSSSEKKRKLSDKMLSPTSNYGIQEASVEQYDKEKVIQIFKPLLKFADSHWSDDDRNDLERLFRKSVESCYTQTEDQPMITKFFRLKK